MGLEKRVQYSKEQWNTVQGFGCGSGPKILLLHTKRYFFVQKPTHQ